MPPPHVRNVGFSNIFQCFECEADECLDPNITYRCGNSLACYEYTYDYKGVQKYKKGCLQNEGDVSMYCGDTKMGDPKRGNMRCCRSALCNNATFTDLSPQLITNSDQMSTLIPDFESLKFGFMSSAPGILIAAGVIIIFLLILIGLCLCIVRLTKDGKLWEKLANKVSHDPVDTPPNDFLEGKFGECSITSGSGSGGPLLGDRTFCREIELKESLYKGRKNEVRRGVWRSMNIAVKIFYSRDEDVWSRERNIYLKLDPGNPFTLKLLGADMVSVNSCTEFWLVTQYCSLGSLNDYLAENNLSYHQCFSLLLSSLSGLEVLHQGSNGCRIAHRDLKSKNILLYSPKMACIADFGLAVSDDEDFKSSYTDPARYKVGTKRYMAPELLNETFNYQEFKNYQKLDIYSFSLVMWEVCRRTSSNTMDIEEFSLPYGNLVPNDPSFDDMKKLVCDDDQRPSFSARVTNDTILSMISKSIQKGWAQNPLDRPTISEIRKEIEYIKTFTFSSPLKC